VPADHPDRRHTDVIGQAERTRSAARFERRRALPTPDSPRRRRTDFINRYRQPLLGLGLLGATTPLARQATLAQAERSGNRQVPAGAPAVPDSSMPVRGDSVGQDAEERLADRIAVSREQAQRTHYVSAAVAEHGIAEQLARDIFDIAREEGVDPDVAIGLVRTESTFNERAVSGVGARGLTQLMPHTARGVNPGTRAEQLFDRRTNLRLGFRYLDQLVQKYGGNLRLALTAYNRGPGTVDRVLKRGGDPDNGYAGKVLGS